MWKHRIVMTPEGWRCMICGDTIYIKPDGRRVCRKGKNETRKPQLYNPLINRPYRAYVENICRRCGFQPEDICQLDVDHIDGNHLNNALDNLQTLCSNCHRLKTKYQRNEKPP